MGTRLLTTERLESIRTMRHQLDNAYKEKLRKLDFVDNDDDLSKARKQVKIMQDHVKDLDEQIDCLFEALIQDHSIINSHTNEYQSGKCMKERQCDHQLITDTTVKQARIESKLASIDHTLDVINEKLSHNARADLYNDNGNKSKVSNSQKAYRTLSTQPTREKMEKRNLQNPLDDWLYNCCDVYELLEDTTSELRWYKQFVSEQSKLLIHADRRHLSVVGDSSLYDGAEFKK